MDEGPALLRNHSKPDVVMLIQRRWGCPGEDLGDRYWKPGRGGVEWYMPCRTPKLFCRADSKSFFAPPAIINLSLRPQHFVLHTSSVTLCCFTQQHTHCHYGHSQAPLQDNKAEK
jgi:hypothetical protein